VLATDRIDFATMQRIARAARCWDLIGNSGRFVRALPLLLGDTPFARLLAFADALFADTGRTHAIANEQLYELLYRWLSEAGDIAPAVVAAALAEDYLASGARGSLSFADTAHAPRERRGGAAPDVPHRQRRHLRATISS